MRHIELRLNTLKRPKFILEAARNGLAGYDPGRHLPALIGRSLHRSKIGQLDCWKSQIVRYALQTPIYSQVALVLW
jgi:hypothetical protein